MSVIFPLVRTLHPAKPVTKPAELKEILLKNAGSHRYLGEENDATPLVRDDAKWTLERLNFQHHKKHWTLGDLIVTFNKKELTIEELRRAPERKITMPFKNVKKTGWLG